MPVIKYTNPETGHVTSAQNDPATLKQYTDAGYTTPTYDVTGSNKTVEQQQSEITSGDNTAVNVSKIQGYVEGETPKPVRTLSNDNAKQEYDKISGEFDTNYERRVADYKKRYEENKRDYEKEGGRDTYRIQGKPMDTALPAKGEFTFEEVQEMTDGDFTGFQRTADGNYIGDEQAMARVGVTGYPTTVDPYDTQEQRAVDQLQKDWLNYDVDSDPVFSEEATNIMAQFSKLRDQMEQVNYSREQALKTMGYRSGTTRYAGQIQLGVEGEELKQANERMSSIISAENSAIAAAKKAREDGKYEDFYRKIQVLKSMRDQKAEEITNYNNKLIAARKAMEEKDVEIDEDIRKENVERGVLNAINSGNYDPIKIATQLKIDGISADIDEITAYTKLRENKGFLDMLTGSEKNYFLMEEFAPGQLESMGIKDIDDWYKYHERKEAKKEQAYTANRKDYEFAGGLEGTGLSFTEWIDRNESGGVSGQDLDKLLTVTEADKLGVPYGTTRRDAMGISVQQGELTTKQLQSAMSLSSQLKSHPMYIDMLDIWGGIQGVRTGLSQGNGFGDITAINAFQRMVDPGATVREGDVALMQSASAIIDKILSDYPLEILQTGAKLPDAVRERMRIAAEQLYQVRAGNYNDSVGEQYKKLADGAGIDFSYIGQDFDTGQDSAQPTLPPINMAQSYLNIEEFKKWNPLYSPMVNEMLQDGISENDILQEMEQLSFDKVGYDTNTVTTREGMRTDRHNNPTAFTTDIAKQGGLIEGKDYTVGDPFSGNRYFTAQLIGDPVEQTIKVIDNIGFYTSGGNQRWTHTAISDSEWNSMSYEEKKKVIQKMYKHEGNKGVLNSVFA